MSIKKIIQNNTNVNVILEQFREEFRSVYKGLSFKEKKIIIKNSDEVFRRWLYSPLISDTNITPNNLINGIAQNHLKSEYTIVPHITINEDLENLENIIFETTYLMYSEESHPVINDINVIMTKYNLIIKLSDKEEYDNYVYDDEFKEIITYKSIYYKKYLLNLMERLGLIKEMKAIGCKCYEVNNKNLDYFRLSTENKLRLIISNSVDIVVDSFNSIPIIDKKIKKEEILKFIKNKANKSMYKDLFEKVDVSRKDFINKKYKFSEDTDINYFSILSSLEFSDMAEFKIGSEIKKHIDKLFTTVFSYYLGIINPIYDKPFLQYEVIKGICEAKENEEKELYIFNSDNFHNMNLLGEKLFLSTRKIKTNNRNLNLSHISIILKNSKIEKKILLDDFKRAKREMLLATKLNTENL